LAGALVTSTAPLPRSLLLAFCLPSITLGFMHAPEQMVQGVYAKHLGLSLAGIAGVLLLTRILDGITYPLIGWFSDFTFRRSGSRKPWIAAGTIVSIAGLWLLYRPPADAGVAWFGIALMVSYIGWKLTEIPYSAWGVELCGDYVQRSRIALWRGMAMMIGGMVFYAVPYLGKATGLTTTSEINFEALSITAVVILVATPLLNWYALQRVPNGEVVVAPTSQRSRESLRAVLRSIFRNGPLLVLLAAYVAMNGLAGMGSAVSYLYFDAYLKLGDKLAAVMLVMGPVALIAFPVWGWLCMRFERHKVWAVASAIGSVAYAGMGFVPEGARGVAAVMVLFPVAGFCILSAGLVVPALLGDATDYGRWKFGEDRAGIYSAVIAFLFKSLGAIAASAAFGLLAWFGFDAAAAEQTAHGALGMKLTAIWLPALGLAVGSVIAWTFPIDRARQQQIRSELQAREATS
jgi:GPH family glycoside/pentoside/hexuronide:cation symporter